MKEYSIGTKCVQAGYEAGNGEPRQIPIIQSTSLIPSVRGGILHQTSPPSGSRVPRRPP